MAQPPAYTPQHAFVADSATLANFPGQQLDVEFQAIKSVTGAIETNLALIQRDDGSLVNGIVTYDTLSGTLQTNGIAPASAWATATAYAVGTGVVQTSSLYRCAVAHTSGVFATDLAAGKWTFVTTFPVGNFVRNGVGVPSASLGVDGDFYIDTVAVKLYGPKTSGAWGAGISLTLASGGTTTQVLHGNASGPPAYSAIVGADLPNPSTTTLGAVFATTAVAGQYISAINSDGTSTQSAISALAAAFSVGGVAYGSAGGGINNFLGADGRIALKAGGVGSANIHQATGGHSFYDFNGATHFCDIQTNQFLIYGSLSGVITLKNQTAAGTYTWGWPTTAGTAGQPLLSGGGAGAAQTYGTLGTAAGGTNLTSATDVAATFLTRGISVQNSGSINDSSSGSGSYVDFTPTFTLPASFLTSARALRITAHLKLTSGTVPPACEIQLKFGSTVVSHHSPGTAAASQTNVQLGFVWIVQALAAPGASVNTNTVLLGNTNQLASPAATVNDTAQPVALATNGTLAITVATKWSAAGTGTTNLTLMQLLVEAIN